VIGFGHPVYTVSDPRNKVIKEVARELSRAGSPRCSTSPSAWNR
jgi:2-methylcitrate synthase